MEVRRFEDLIVWQLADALRTGVVAFTADGSASRDFKYCDQIRDAAASACRNIAEGFGRFRPTEFARYLEIAAGSLQEVKDALHDGHRRKYVDDSEHERLVRLALRTLKASYRLREYLQSERAANFWKHARRSRSTNRFEPKEPREP